MSAPLGNGFPQPPIRVAALATFGLLLLLVMASGCVNTLAIASKVFMGDPKQPSAFRAVTGESLEDSEKTVLLYCSAPLIISDEFGSLSADLQEELIQRMRRHKVNVLPPDAGINVIDRIGRFDADAIGHELKHVDYIMHVKLDGFTLTEPNSPDLRRSRAQGTITGYVVEKDDDGQRTVIQLFEHNFGTEYPVSHPIPSEQMSENVFRRRSVDFLADSLGATFYDVSLNSLFAR